MTIRKNVHDYEISYEFWNKIKSLLPFLKPKKKSEIPGMDDKRILSDIFYLLRTWCQWKALLRFYRASGTVHDLFQEWQRSGFFENMWQAGLMEYDKFIDNTHFPILFTLYDRNPYCKARVMAELWKCKGKSK